MRKVLLICTIVVGLVVAACGAEPSPTPGIFDSPLPGGDTPTSTDVVPTGEPSPDTFESPLNMPNPASKFCEEQGNELELRQEAGGSVGYCIFPDGSECEEWAFYRGECGPGTPRP